MHVHSRHTGQISCFESKHSFSHHKLISQSLLLCVLYGTVYLKVPGQLLNECMYKISFKKEGLPSSECFHCFVRHLGTFFGTQ